MYVHLGLVDDPLFIPTFGTAFIAFVCLNRIRTNIRHPIRTVNIRSSISIRIEFQTKTHSQPHNVSTQKINASQNQCTQRTQAHTHTARQWPITQSESMLGKQICSQLMCCQPRCAANRPFERTHRFAGMPFWIWGRCRCVCVCVLNLHSTSVCVCGLSAHKGYVSNLATSCLRFRVAVNEKAHTQIQIHFGHPHFVMHRSV